MDGVQSEPTRQSGQSSLALAAEAPIESGRETARLGRALGHDPPSVSSKTPLKQTTTQKLRIAMEISLWNASTERIWTEKSKTNGWERKPPNAI
ncbi:unnamed protein product, partial [Aphanomyces euteiches]